MRPSAETKNVKVLVACEFSGAVRNAFLRLGNDAWSCDLLPSVDGSDRHIIGDVLNYIDDGWDLMIAHPPCTYLANSGAKHLYKGMKKENGPNPERWAKMREAALFYKTLRDAPIKRKAIENPIMLGYARKIIGGGFTQIIQPWQYGHGETKATGLELVNLPKLNATNIVDGREQRIFKLPPSKDRWKLRSTTYQGIADAMAMQWGGR